MSTPDLRPMSEFDPSKPSMVHDQLNDDTFEWVTEKWREHYERYASEHAPEAECEGDVGFGPKGDALFGF